MNCSINAPNDEKTKYMVISCTYMFLNNNNISPLLCMPKEYSTIHEFPITHAWHNDHTTDTSMINTWMIHGCSNAYKSALDGC